MAITDYTTLRASIQAWTARTNDTVFNGQIPTFVELAEDRMYNGAGERGEPMFSAPLRSKYMEVEGTVTVTDGTGSLPDEALEIREISVQDQKTGLEFLPPERFRVFAANNTAGTPVYYTTRGSTIDVAPASSVTLDLTYYRRYDTITASNSTGPLIAAHGLIYLECCLYEAFAFMQADDLALAHLTRARGMIDGANRTAANTRTAGPLRIRQRNPIP
jgi:hypothetical protein